MRTLIVDDEPLARARLKRLLSAHTQIDCIGEAENATDALDLVQQLQPDLVMLDIEMPDTDGLALAETINQLPLPPAIIFVTAHPQHALDAYSVGPSDYLLKPVDASRLKTALERVGTPTRAHIEKQDELNPWISYQVGNSLRRIRFDKVQYFMAEDKVVKMVFDGGEAILNESLNRIEASYQGLVVRAHRHLLINISRMNTLNKIDGLYFVSLYGCDERLNISRRKASELKIYIFHNHSSA
ncbi:DNA-binding response regulator [Nitrincola tibetensis]|uniref:DNA-binding response regulator n=1 Tax=Nitrincola tibetensis TaxID=2219697 RepID=A0A364NKG7_9GAMM|nr:response regulator transcription factor [Nitrincola tibetensis]RAU17365.1 DNA-binding response regulator [Nitrincola tibetensis]